MHHDCREAISICGCCLTRIRKYPLPELLSRQIKPDPCFAPSLCIGSIPFPFCSRFLPAALRGRIHLDFASVSSPLFLFLTFPSPPSPPFFHLLLTIRSSPRFGRNQNMPPICDTTPRNTRTTSESLFNAVWRDTIRK